MKSSCRKYLGAVLAAVYLLVLALHAGAEEANPKVAELKKNFEKGIELLSQRKYAEARGIFDKNIADDPKSLGSLLYAGIASNELYEPKKALEYFEKYRAFNASDERVKFGMLRAYQALGMNKEAEAQVAELREQKKNGLGKYLPIMSDFERERIQQPNGQAISVLEVFDPKPMRAVWKYLLLDASVKPVRLVEIVEASEAATAKARSVDPKIGDKAVYLLQETSIGGGEGYKIFKTLIGIPSYDEGRTMALEVFAGKVKPIMESGGK